MNQMRFAFGHELIVDLFAGGGGASLGIEQAFGRPVDVAVNHSADAVAMHQANHPQTVHLQCDVFEVNPLQATGGRQVGLLWASPDCKHFSKAKGGKPRSKKIRSLAWVVVKWATLVRPRVIMLENVEEFVTWGPLGPDNQPCPQRKGQTFKRWVGQLRKLGYVVEWKELRACDYGTPTIRKRFFLVARCDGLPIRWPAPTHGKPDSVEVRKGKLLPWRTAAECINWNLPCHSIFLTKEEGRASA
jgi:DNA (cytosine-5)-methyltransferase 1